MTPTTLPSRLREIKERAARATAHEWTEADGMLFNVARKDVPFLVSELESALAENERLRKELEAEKWNARRFLYIAGACLSGTMEAEQIAAENENPGDAFNAAMRIHRARQDETLAAWTKPIIEQRDSAQRYSAKEKVDD